MKNSSNVINVLYPTFHESLSKSKCRATFGFIAIPVNKIFTEQNTPESKVKALIPMYEPLEVSRCEKCGKVIAEPKELIRIVRK